MFQGFTLENPAVDRKNVVQHVVCASTPNRFCVIVAIYGCNVDFKSELRQNGWRKTETTCKQKLLGCRASHELCLNHLSL